MRHTVLIADDDPDQHVLCGLYLEHAGMRVLHARDGAEAVELAVRECPDLVLMDLRMPRMDGAAALRALRSADRTRSIPVIAVSADVLAWNRSRALREGFAAHLAKPCDLREILDAVRRYAGRPSLELSPTPEPVSVLH
jgi:CheY-like chemotaxis protein